MTKNELATALIEAFANILYSIEEVEVKPKDTLFEPKRMSIKLNVNEYERLERYIVEYMNFRNTRPMGLQKIGTTEKKWECVLQGIIDFERV